MPPKKRSINTLMERSIPFLPDTIRPLDDLLGHVPTKKRSNNLSIECVDHVSQVRNQEFQERGQKSVFSHGQGFQSRSLANNVSNAEKGSMHEVFMDNFEEEFQERNQVDNFSSKKGSLVRTQVHMENVEEEREVRSQVPTISFGRESQVRIQPHMENFEQELEEINQVSNISSRRDASVRSRAFMQNVEDFQERRQIDDFPSRKEPERRSQVPNISYGRDSLMRTQLYRENIEEEPQVISRVCNNSSRRDSLVRSQAHTENIEEGEEPQVRSQVQNDSSRRDSLVRNQAYVENIEEGVDVNVQRKATRGKTRLQSVAPKNGKKHVCIVKKVPVGEGRRKLSNYLGIMARDSHLFPLHKCWGKEHDLGLERVMVEIRDDFKFLNPDGTILLSYEKVNHFCKATIRQQLRDWRHNLKKNYIPGLPIEEQLQQSPDKGVTNGEWANLLMYWSDPKTLVEATRNKNNRKGAKPTHTSGPISYAEAEFDAEQKNQDSSLLGIYLKCHQKKNGEYPNDHTKFFCEKLEKRSKECGVEKTKDPLEFIPIMDETFGPHHGGSERGFSAGILRRTLRRESLVNASDKAAYDNVQIQLQQKERQMDQLLAEKDRQIAELRARLRIIEEQDDVVCNQADLTSPSSSFGQSPRVLNKNRCYSTSMRVSRPPTPYI